MSHLHSVSVARSSGGRVRPGLRSALAFLVLLALLGGVLVARASTHRTASPHYTYGGLPKWLPASTHATNRVLQASAARPQLAIEGDVIRVALGSGVSALATMTGPQTPPFVAPPPPSTTATITINVRAASGSFALRARDFALIDGNGAVLRPTTFLDGRRSVMVSTRGATAVRIREFMAIGSGSIRWAPAGHPVVTWEFTVEND